VPTTTTSTDREVTKPTFSASIIASDAADAIARVERRLPEGFAVTGRTGVRSAKHQLLTVEVENHGGDIERCWVTLTSYGISPSKDLGSAWDAAERRRLGLA
jgi:hypothetical protein